MPIPQGKDWVGGPRLADTGRYGILNGNKRCLYTKDLKPTKGNAEMWSYKYKGGSKLQRHMDLKRLLVQECGKQCKEGVTEELSRLQGFKSSSKCEGGG